MFPVRSASLVAEQEEFRVPSLILLPLLFLHEASFPSSLEHGGETLFTSERNCLEVRFSGI